jgi:hypothetical protein
VKVTLGGVTVNVGSLSQITSVTGIATGNGDAGEVNVRVPLYVPAFKPAGFAVTTAPSCPEGVLVAFNQDPPELVDTENAAPALGPETRTVCDGGGPEPVCVENVTDGGEKVKMFDPKSLNRTGTITVLFGPVMTICPL